MARRLTAALSRPTAEIEDDVADVHTLRRELRRLRAEVLRLEEDKRVLEERVRFPRARAGGDAEEVPAGHVNLVERDGSAQRRDQGGWGTRRSTIVTGPHHESHNDQ